MIELDECDPAELLEPDEPEEWAEAEPEPLDEGCRLSALPELPELLEPLDDPRSFA